MHARASPRRCSHPTGKQLRVIHPKAVKQPAIDCFYVYPTVSGQKTTLANFKVDPVERSIALYQAARYSQYCRVFAPMYRQVTLTALLAGTKETPARAEDPGQRRPQRLPGLPGPLQPRARVRADRPLPGVVRAPQRGGLATSTASPPSASGCCRRSCSGATCWSNAAPTSAVTSSTSGPATPPSSSAAWSRSRPSTPQSCPRACSASAANPQQSVLCTNPGRARRGLGQGRPDRALSAVLPGQRACPGHQAPGPPLPQGIDAVARRTRRLPGGVLVGEQRQRAPDLPLGRRNHAQAESGRHLGPAPGRRQHRAGQSDRDGAVRGDGVRQARRASLSATATRFAIADRATAHRVALARARSRLAAETACSAAWVCLGCSSCGTCPQFKHDVLGRRERAANMLGERRAARADPAGPRRTGSAARAPGGGSRSRRGRAAPPGRCSGPRHRRRRARAAVR